MKRAGSGARTLLDEKELTRCGDELARRRSCPSVRIDKESRFETDQGARCWQLLHFMFGSGYAAGCAPCSPIVDGFDGFVGHLANHDVTLSIGA